MRYFVLIVVLLLAFAGAAVAFRSDLVSRVLMAPEPGLTVIPAAERRSKPGHSEEIAGHYRIIYSGERGWLCQGLESWKDGERRQGGRSDARLDGDVQLEGMITLKNIHGDVAEMAKFLSTVQKDLAAAELGEIPHEEVKIPARFVAPKYEANFGFRSQTTRMSHRGIVGVSFPSDEDLSCRIVHAPRKHIPFASQDEVGGFEQQPIVWGCFFNAEEDQERMSIFAKQDWSDRDFEDAASHSAYAVLLRMWVLEW